MPSLSVLCPTRDPGPQVRALLEPIRAAADEIVIAVDSRAGDAQLPEYAAVADRVLRYERGPGHSALSWLFEQCRGDWVLIVAGDEILAPELIAALPGLISGRRAAQFSFPLRWLWPTAETWLCDTPWHPDFQRRLVRNDGLTRFAGLPHELALPVIPHQLLDLPIWHLSLMSSPEERRAKVARNQRDRVGLVAPGGGELNATYYLPEDGTPRTAPVPSADREAIRRVQEAVPRPTTTPAKPPLGVRADIEPLWAQRTVGPGAFRANVTPLVPGPFRMRAGETRMFFVRVRNEGDERWPYGFDLPPLFRLGFRWEDGAEGRTAFTHEIRPGEEAVVPVLLAAPATSRRVSFDVLLENERWFGAPCVVEVEVS